MAESWGDEDELVEMAAAQGDPQANMEVDTMWGDDDEYINPDEPEPPKPDDIAWFEHIPGAVETGLTFLSGAYGEIAGGFSGLGAAAGTALAGGDADQVAQNAAQAVEDTRGALTYEARTDAGQAQMQGLGEVLAPVGEAYTAVEGGLGEGALDITGSPGAAAAAHSLPTLALELTGLGVFRRTSQAAQTAKRLADEGLDAEMGVEVVTPEAKSWEEITQDLVRSQSGDVADQVMPDADIVKAAEELGITLNPSHYSTNEAYKRVEQAIKSQPGTKLAEREAIAIKELAEKGDELIRDMDGELDRSILDDTIRTRMTNTIDELEDAADGAYRMVNDFIPPATKVEPRTARRYIDQRLAELGDDVSLLAPVERKLYRMLSRDKPPTYNALDTLRRDIGDGYKRKGEFKDDADGVLDQVYSVLINDQSMAAKAMGAEGEFNAARKLVQQRKNIEKRAMTMFGRQMTGSVLPKLSQAANKMTKGDVTQFEELMKALPSDMRQKAAVSMLNDIYTLGARSKSGGIGQGFANAFDMLDRNAGARDVLFKYLPDEAQGRFMALGRVSQGIYRAKALENTSRTARDILQALEAGTMAQRVIGRALGGAARVTGWKVAGHYGAAAADQADRAVRNSVKREAAADELLSSSAFERALNKAAEGKVREAEIMLKRSASWQKWRGLVGEGTVEQIRAMGAIAWLTQQEEQPEAAPNVQ